MSGSSITYGETMSQAEPPSHERRIDVTGAYNVRDLGGYPTVDGRTTRRGHFIRADRLSALPAQALRVHGNMDGAHADNPQSAADRLTRQQVDDGTHDLLKRRDIVLGIH